MKTSNVSKSANVISSASQSIWLKIAEPSLIEMMREMSTTDHDIVKYQKSRTFVSLLLFVAMAMMGLALNSIFYYLAIFLPPIYYITRMNEMNNKYLIYKFNRHKSFAHFIRILIPFLKQSEGNEPLYHIFEKLTHRLKDPEDKRSLWQLITEMESDSTSMEPFISFAKRQSADRRAVIFMVMIYQYRQTTFDTDIIDELGSAASKELSRSINEIIMNKVKRLAFFPMKIAYPILIVIVGYTVGMLMDFWTVFGM